MNKKERERFIIRRMDYLSDEWEKLDWFPHIDLWQSHPAPAKFSDKYSKNQDWYVSVQYYEENSNPDERPIRHFIPVTDWLFYSDAVEAAIKFGNELNIPVVQHDISGPGLLWIPGSESNQEQTDKLNAIKDRTSPLIFNMEEI